MQADWATRNWWFVPGDFVWVDGLHAAKYVGDDGLEWGLAVGEQRKLEGAPENATWDHKVHELRPAHPLGLSDEQVRQLTDNLIRISPPRDLSRVKVAIIDEVAKDVPVRGWQSGKKIRHALREYGKKNVDRQLKELCPRYLKYREGNQGDYYELTLAGFPASRLRQDLERILNVILTVLHDEYDEDPELLSYSWAQLKDGGLSDDEVQLARSVIGASMLSTSFGDRTWRVPEHDEMEAVSEVTEYNEFLRYLRSGNHSAPAPTAPMLPFDLLDPAEKPVKVGHISVHQRPMENIEDDSRNGAAMAENAQKVFVVHGRNLAARDGMFDFLRSIGLQPIEWSQAVKLTGKGAPYIGEILDAAFNAAQAIVVLMTPDEIAYLRGEYATGTDDPESKPAAQARPNVLFEAGMALGRSADRTILVELGQVRPFSDVAGRHALRLDGAAAGRKDLAERLQTAGCAVDLSGTDWLTKGHLTPAAPPGGGLPLGKRAPAPPSTALRIDAQYVDRGRGNGRLQITNHSQFDLFDVTFELPDEAGPSFHVQGDLPIKKLPSGKTVSFVTMRTLGGGGSDHFEIPISARTADGDPVEVEAFVSLVG